MSRKIDPQKIEDGTLTDDEIKYLSDRNQLPEDYETQVEPKRIEPELGPNTGDANTQKPQNPNIGEEEETEDEDDEEPSGDDDDTESEDDEDDEEEDYDEGWTNDTRRGELQKRGLSIDGNKDELIARLIADDKSK